MAKQKFITPELRSTKREWKVLTKTPKLQSHVHHFSHKNFGKVKVVGFEANYHERLFFVAWHSTLDPNARHADHILLPEAYKGIAQA